MKYTIEELNEIKKCITDIEYFTENYIKVNHPIEGIISLSLTDFQKETIQNFQQHKTFGKLSNRQSGKTTVACIILLHIALFENYKTSAIIARNHNEAVIILDLIRDMHSNLPDFLKSTISKNNKDCLVFDNGCSIFAFGEKSNKALGRTLNTLYIDEIEFFAYPIRAFSNILPIMASSGQKIFALSSSRIHELLEIV